MKFREDINGLRAIAVIAVVLFHFNPSWMPGGFAGVDVFFVISGFLMTGIIFRGIEQENFSILKFYVARANRIIPALSALCLVLLVFGWFYLIPSDYISLGKHASSSIAFISNIIYTYESGYFDASSHQKWLLHTWSLSVEWQFYIIYPVILVIMSKFLSINTMRRFILLGTILGFIFCIIATYKWPTPAYFLLPTRAWEMMFGGIAYIYPLKLKDINKKRVELIGVILIFSSYLFITKEMLWPGYLALIPVFGSFLVIQAHSGGFITSNVIFQKLGLYSYSIYLWHWPLVVGIYYFSLQEHYIYIGLIASVLLGWLSNRYIENIKFKNSYISLKSYLTFKPFYILLTVFFIGYYAPISNGYTKQIPLLYNELAKSAIPSPYRDKCHINKYQNPADACEYFSPNISWAVFGDSHSTEIAYSLAKRLELENKGLKHFTFSGCKSAYNEKDNFTKCARWYNQVVNYITEHEEIENVVINHRFTTMLIGGDSTNYPKSNPVKITEDTIHLTENIDKLILHLAHNKKNVYIFYPIPELDRDIKNKIFLGLKRNPDSLNIIGTSLDWYEERNRYIINHFNEANYPSNVHLLKTSDLFCDDKNCFAVKKGKSLYFDDNHLSIQGAKKLVEIIEY